MISEDLSGGFASYKIPVINTVDSEPVFNRYHYINSNVEQEGFRQTKLDGCDCVGECLPNKCKCIKQSTINIVDQKICFSKGVPEFYGNILYECSEQTCKGCKGRCKWRLTPKKFDLKVELFKTMNAGWAVRSTQFIEAGTFFGEFVGEILDSVKLAARPTDYAYMLLRELNKDSNICLKGPDVRFQVEQPSDGEDVDPHFYGNITRFLNHSCFENLTPFRFYSSHRDETRLSLGFFASRDITPGDELTIDYGIDWWLQKIEEAKKKDETFYCYCSWYYCLNPAPGKLQMNQEEAQKEMQQIIVSKHEMLEKWKKGEERRRIRKLAGGSGENMC